MAAASAPLGYAPMEYSASLGSPHQSIESLLDDWCVAKRKKDFRTADALRDQLRTRGVEPDMVRPPGSCLSDVRAYKRQEGGASAPPGHLGPLDAAAVQAAPLQASLFSHMLQQASFTRTSVEQAGAEERAQHRLKQPSLMTPLPKMEPVGRDPVAAAVLEEAIAAMQQAFASMGGIAALEATYHSGGSATALQAAHMAGAAAATVAAKVAGGMPVNAPSQPHPAPRPPPPPPPPQQQQQLQLPLPPPPPPPPPRMVPGGMRFDRETEDLLDEWCVAKRRYRRHTASSPPQPSHRFANDEPPPSHPE